MIKNVIVKRFSLKIPKNLEIYFKLAQNNSSIESLLPKRFDKNFKNYLDRPSIVRDLNLTQNLIDSTNTGIVDPCWDILERGGKRWRYALGLIIGRYLKIDIEDPKSSKNLHNIGSLTEILHSGSLIIDDFEDKSELRRFKKCIHLIYGIYLSNKLGESIAINAGISLYFLPVLKLIDSLNDTQRLRILEIFIEEMSSIHIGQGWDIEMQVNKRLPYIEDYRNTVLFKTGVFPRFLVKTIFALYEGENSDQLKIARDRLIEILDYISIAFQIKDDLLNITDSNVANSKGFLGEDIFEGKFTLMIIHSFENKFPNVKRLKEILDLKTKDPSLLKEAIEILSVNKSIQYADNIMNGNSKKANEGCESLKMLKLDRLNPEALQDVQDLLKLLLNI